MHVQTPLQISGEDPHDVASLKKKLIFGCSRAIFCGAKQMKYDWRASADLPTQTQRLLRFLTCDALA